MVIGSGTRPGTHPLVNPGERIMNPAVGGGVTQDLSENVILATGEGLYNWTGLSRRFPLLYGTACCFSEFGALLGSRFDFDRLGLAPRASPRQADLIIVAGTVTMKMAPALVRLYEQMPKPAYVIAMGACTITGGMFRADSPTALRGVDKIIPVDVYIPGCPPRPEAIFDAMMRKEVYATTGPRIKLRFFAGCDFDSTDAQAADFAERGYAKGVPMGGDVSACDEGAAPSFLVHSDRKSVV